MTALLAYWRELLIVGLLVAVVGQQSRVANEEAAHAQTKADHAQTKADHAAVLLELAEKTKASYEAVVKNLDAQQKLNAEIDSKHSKELSHALTENRRLADCVRAGTCGVRIRATCPAATPTDVPQAPGTGSVADDAGPRLDEAAERDFFHLRAGIETARKQIDGLQDYISRVCLGSPPSP